MSQEQSEEEKGLVTTEDGRFDGETAEPEVIICLPRHSDPAPELVTQATTMGQETVSTDAESVLRTHLIRWAAAEYRDRAGNRPVHA